MDGLWDQGTGRLGDWWMGSKIRELGDWETGEWTVGSGDWEIWGLADGDMGTRDLWSWGTDGSRDQGACHQVTPPRNPSTASALVYLSQWT